MIEYHKNNEIDREQWDNCIVKSHHHVKPYAFSWYLDIMAPGWEALVDDDYDSVFPIPGFRKFGIQYVATPAFLQQLGAYSPDKPATIALAEFLDFMPGFYKLIDLCVTQESNHAGFRITKRDNFELDLSKPYESIWNDFSSDCRKYIESGNKRKYEIVSDILPDELIDLYLKNRNIRPVKAKDVDIQRLRNLMNYCVKNRKGRLSGIRSKGRKLIFGIFLVETHGNKTILLIAGSHESDAHHLGYFVINDFIRSHSSSRAILDFAVSSFSKSDFYGASFGCADVPYFRIYRNRLLWPASMIR